MHLFFNCIDVNVDRKTKNRNKQEAIIDAIVIIHAMFSVSI